jgi:hypothetical protein
MGLWYFAIARMVARQAVPVNALVPTYATLANGVHGSLPDGQISPSTYSGAHRAALCADPLARNDGRLGYLKNEFGA